MNKRDIGAYIVSFCLHGLMVGGAISFAALPLKPQAPLLVDFTLERDQPAEAIEKGDTESRSTPVAHKRSVFQRRETTVAARPPATLPAPAESVAKAETIAAISEAGPVAIAVPTRQKTVGASTPETGGVPPAITGEGAPAMGGPGEDAAGKASGPSGKSAESLRARFLKEHLAYIRNMIAEHLRYPSQARRMGWSGKLTIEFVIRESGGVDTIRVVKSSGFPLLDRDAEDTVRRSAPFPKPPVSARLVIPVEYLLE